VTTTTERRRLAATPETADEDPLPTHLMTTRMVAITADAPCSTALQLMAATAVRSLAAAGREPGDGDPHEAR
jgi:hypothetical protein